MSGKNISAAEEVALEAQVMALILQRVPQYKIAEQLGVSRFRVSKICNNEGFLNTLKTEGDRMRSVVREQFKSRLDELSPLAYEALKHNLKEHKIEAVRLFAEMVGLRDKSEEEGQKDTTLVVNMPGARLEGVIPATATKVEDEVSDSEIQ